MGIEVGDAHDREVRLLKEQIERLQKDRTNLLAEIEKRDLIIDAVLGRKKEA